MTIVRWKQWYMYHYSQNIKPSEHVYAHLSLKLNYAYINTWGPFHKAAYDQAQD